MKVRHTFRFYPSKPQERILAKTFGCVRVAYNSALQLRINSYKAGTTINYNASSAALTALKKTPERAFLNEVSSVPMQQALRHLQSAFVNFFEKRSEFPRFKSKHGKQSAEYTTSGFKWDPRNRNLTISKIGRIDVHWSRSFTSCPTTATITKREDGRYFVTLCLNETIEPLPKTNLEVGVDLGVNRLATLSNGERISNPKHTARNLAKLQHAQRVLSRRKKGSGRWCRQRLKVAKIHSHIRDSRKDYLDKFTTDLVKRFDVIAIEDLNVRGMVKNHCLSGAISNTGFGMFRKMVDYKCKWNGKQLRVADRFFPSSKRCSGCGYVTESLSLKIREWSCSKCGMDHDRDENAAINILNFAGGQPVKARGERVRHGKALASPCSVQ